MHTYIAIGHPGHSFGARHARWRLLSQFKSSHLPVWVLSEAPEALAVSHRSVRHHRGGCHHLARRHIGAARRHRESEFDCRPPARCRPVGQECPAAAAGRVAMVTVAAAARAASGGRRLHAARRWQFLSPSWWPLDSADRLWSAVKIMNSSFRALSGNRCCFCHDK